MTARPGDRERHTAPSDRVFALFADARLDEALAAPGAAPDELAPWQAELAHVRTGRAGARPRRRAARRRPGRRRARRDEQVLADVAGLVTS